MRTDGGAVLCVRLDVESITGVQCDVLSRAREAEDDRAAKAVEHLVVGVAVRRIRIAGAV